MNTNLAILRNPLKSLWQSTNKNLKVKFTYCKINVNEITLTIRVFPTTVHQSQ